MGDLPICRVVGLPLIGDGGVVAGLIGVVGDHLHAAVGQLDVVLALRAVAVAGLRVAEVRPGVLVLSRVVELVLGWALQIGRTNNENKTASGDLIP